MGNSLRCSLYAQALSAAALQSILHRRPRSQDLLSRHPQLVHRSEVPQVDMLKSSSKNMNFGLRRGLGKNFVDIIWVQDSAPRKGLEGCEYAPIDDSESDGD